MNQWMRDPVTKLHYCSGLTESGWPEAETYLNNFKKCISYRKENTTRPRYRDLLFNVV
jgi:hypothetical protein